jgi:hypothetical protein
MKTLTKAWVAVPFTAALLSFGTAAPAFAQIVGDSLVTVNIQNVANNIAQNLSVDVSQIPVTVEAPIGIAANVCDVSAAVLAEQDRSGDGATCTATSTSTALNRIVQREIG